MKNNVVVVFKTGLVKTIECYSWIIEEDAKCYELGWIEKVDIVIQFQ